MSGVKEDVNEHQCFRLTPSMFCTEQLLAATAGGRREMNLEGDEFGEYCGLRLVAGSITLCYT
jgi:hypothetical protein